MRSSFVVGLIAVLLATAVLTAQEGSKKEAPKKEPSIWMKQKLKYSQEILNGLAYEDYTQIGKNARAMKGMTQVEYFVRQRPEGYRTQLKSFQYSVNELIRTSEAKNLDGATLAFTQMTISCVNCHRELRKQ